MKFTLKKNPTNSHWSKDTTTVTHEFDSEALDDVLENFLDFLSGCGFQLQDKEILIVDKESK